MKRIDRFPTRKIVDIEYGRGSVLPLNGICPLKAAEGVIRQAVRQL